MDGLLYIQHVITTEPDVVKVILEYTPNINQQTGDVSTGTPLSIWPVRWGQP